MEVNRVDICPPCPDLATPKRHLGVVLGHSLVLPLLVPNPKVVLRVGVTLFSRLAIPKRSLSIVLGNAVALVVRKPKVVLRVGVTLFRRLAKPENGLSVVLRYSLTQ